MIHKTKKEEGKIGPFYPLRWEFRLFWPDSRSISACFDCFGHFGRRPIQPDSGRISSGRCKSSRVGVKKKKKKQLRRDTNTRATASGCVGLRCGTLPAMFVLSSWKHERWLYNRGTIAEKWIKKTSTMLRIKRQYFLKREKIGGDRST